MINRVLYCVIVGFIYVKPIPHHSLKCRCNNLFAFDAFVIVFRTFFLITIKQIKKYAWTNFYFCLRRENTERRTAERTVAWWAVMPPDCREKVARNNTHLKCQKKVRFFFIFYFLFLFLLFIGLDIFHLLVTQLLFGLTKSLLLAAGVDFSFAAVAWCLQVGGEGGRLKFP